MSNQEEIAGGMSYRTMKGIETRIMSYLAGRNLKSSTAIFEKNKEYYIASANKIIARFELAKIRIENIDISEKDKQMLYERLQHGLKWLFDLKNNIRKAEDNEEFQKVISYKKWHAVKLIPSAAEGYAIAASIEEELESNINLSDDKKLEGSKLNIQEAKSNFLELLNLNEDSDFEIAEKRRIKAYEELNFSYEMLYGK